MSDPSLAYVSRGGLKLAAALDAFAVRPAGLCCADLGCNVGGFTDCLLQRGAAKVHAVDTGYGTLAWKLRGDPRVVTHERRNALHLDPSSIEDFAGCGLVVLDLGWTRQRHAIPAALRWLAVENASSPTGQPTRDATHGDIVVGGAHSTPDPFIISLIKPHYEAEEEELARAGQGQRQGRRGVLDPADARIVLDRVLAAMPALGVQVRGCIASPILGGGSRGKEGNVEYLALLAPKPPATLR